MSGLRLETEASGPSKGTPRMASWGSRGNLIMAGRVEVTQPCLVAQCHHPHAHS